MVSQLTGEANEKEESKENEASQDSAEEMPAMEESDTEEYYEGLPDDHKAETDDPLPPGDGEKNASGTAEPDRNNYSIPASEDDSDSKAEPQEADGIIISDDGEIVQKEEMEVDEQRSDPESGRIIRKEEAYQFTAFDFFDKAQELVSTYPDLLEMDILGYSADGRSVYAVVMGKGIRDRSYEELYIRRYQLMMEAGNHSRETINSYLLMMTIEDYCMDVHDSSHIPDVNISAILDQSTFHFLILTNPDGYDAVKHGVDAIRNTTLRQNLIRLLDGRSLSLLKAGIEGTDRNRNFEDEYYHVGTKRWINQFYSKNANSPKEPSLGNYPGPYPASAIETQLVQNYIKRYPFRAFISYHSMGQVVYYVKEYLSTSFNENVLKPFAEMAAASTGYRTIHYVSSTSAGGYFTHYAVNLTQKPAVTIETTAIRAYPTSIEYYETEYDRVQLLPYQAMQYVINKGYYPYKVYVGGKFFKDYQSEAYANGVAEKFKGKVVTQVGTPVYEYILVHTDGRKISFSVASGAPFINNGRSMLPVRRVAETLGADVDWNQKLYRAEIYWDDQCIEIPINRDYIYINGKRIEMDTINLLEHNRTYVPLRYVFQGMGYEVSWKWENRRHNIRIDSP